MKLAMQAAEKLREVHKQTERSEKMEQDMALALRERAVAALQESTTMLNVAQNLLEQGNETEAARLRNEARNKRNESILLMDQALSAERGSDLRFTHGKAAA